MTRFLDRSNVNGHDEYKTAGVTHLYLKVSEGTGFVDATYKERRDAAHLAGAVVGGYHFAQHGDPVAEANHFLALVGKPKAGQLRPCLDLESGENASWAEAFVDHCHAVLGYWPVLYGNTSTIPALRSASKSVAACPWWRAEFSVNDGQHHPLNGGDMGAAAHQYTSTATFPGISGRTDASVFINEAAMLVPSTAPPKPVKWTVQYHTKLGKARTATTAHPGDYLEAHPNEKFNGRIIITPVHPKK